MSERGLPSSLLPFTSHNHPTVSPDLTNKRANVSHICTIDQALNYRQRISRFTEMRHLRGVRSYLVAVFAAQLGASVVVVTCAPVSLVAHSQQGTSLHSLTLRASLSSVRSTEVDKRGLTGDLFDVVNQVFSKAHENPALAAPAVQAADFNALKRSRAAVEASAAKLQPQLKRTRLDPPQVPRFIAQTVSAGTSIPSAAFPLNGAIRDSVSPAQDAHTIAPTAAQHSGRLRYASRPAWMDVRLKIGFTKKRLAQLDSTNRAVHEELV